MNEPVSKIPPQAFSPDTLLSLLIPVLALAAFTGLLATLAVFFGWFPREMILIDAIAGALMLLSISALAYLRIEARNAARGALDNARTRLASSRLMKRSTSCFLMPPPRKYLAGHATRY
jgi:Zn-dependent protease with chaperone function